jgi:hypothetical protein
MKLNGKSKKLLQFVSFLIIHLCCNIRFGAGFATLCGSGDTMSMQECWRGGALVAGLSRHQDFSHHHDVSQKLAALQRHFSFSAEVIPPQTIPLLWPPKYCILDYRIEPNIPAKRESNLPAWGEPNLSAGESQISRPRESQISRPKEIQTSRPKEIQTSRPERAKSPGMREPNLPTHQNHLFN